MIQGSTREDREALCADLERRLDALWTVQPNRTAEEHKRLGKLRRRDREQYEAWLKT